ncbi:hypothetical protein FACS1894211_02720 [Clostridia bacterium]|nr:hypothetical protein FACS1894211_02720 [Clostridia bacterium]
MDVIQQMIHGSGEILAKFLFHKEEDHEIVVEYAASSREVGILIWSLLASNDYGEAEALLLRELDDRFDFDLYDTGLEFFNALAQLTDGELAEHSYSREKIDEGAGRLFGILKKKCGLKAQASPDSGRA